MMTEIQKEGEFEFIESGEGELVVLLHGLMGALSNFKETIDFLNENGYKVVIPLLPVYTLPLLKTSAKGIARYFERFIKHKGYSDLTLLGNSLGGHVGLIYTRENPSLVKRLVLTGSSGLYENSMGDTFPRREDYDFIKRKTEEVFYDPTIATKELVDEIFETVNSRDRVLRVIALAKSAIRHNMSKDLPNFKLPTCLIWGQNDIVTPPEVAEEFHSLIPNSELFWIEKCGHAAMMERPKDFNEVLLKWLKKNPIS